MLHYLRHLIAAAALGLTAFAAHATVDPALLQPLAGDDPDARIEAVGRIAALANDDARKVLQALQDDALYATPDDAVLVVDGEQAWDPASGKTLAMPDGVDGIVVNNRLRSAVEGALSAMALRSLDSGQRRAAALALQARSLDPAQLQPVRTAFAAERDPDIKAILQAVIAGADLHSPDPALRKAALAELADSGGATLRPHVQALLEKNEDGSHAEPDAGVRAAAAAALSAIDGRASRAEFAGNLFYGVSLGSVLLLAALGLAITFGLMGIINMAHGEFLMIGAYTTYVVQSLFRTYLPGALDWYLAAALPAAFAVTFAVGMLLERSVIRWLYGRPLETLLATWGISLMLMQLVRTIFGAQNVEVANPSWMAGGGRRDRARLAGAVL